MAKKRKFQKPGNQKMAKTVVIYTAPHCAYCRLAKKFFLRYGVEYEEWDVSENERARNRMQKISGQLGVPVIEAGDEVFVGFDESALFNALDLKPKT